MGWFGTLLQILLRSLETGGIYALAALGIIIIFRTSNITHFAQGAMGMFNTYLAAVLVDVMGLPLGIGVVAAIVMAVLLGTHLMSDGSVVHTCGGKVGGILEPVTAENIKEFGMLRLMDSPKMKGLLNTVSMPNWYHCIDEALRKSGKTREDIDFLDILHIKRSGHKGMLADLGLTEDQTIYLENYGHIGQIDQILSLKLALEQGKVKDGDNVVMIAAGIGYTWAANVIQWGEA